MPETRDPEIETLMRGYELYNRQQFDALMDLLAPDVVLIRDGEQLPVRGRDQIRAFMEPDAFEYQRLEPVDVQRSGDALVVRVRVRAKGAASEIELDMTGWHVWRLEDGLATRLVATFNEKKARAEAGLPV